MFRVPLRRSVGLAAAGRPCCSLRVSRSLEQGVHGPGRRRRPGLPPGHLPALGSALFAFALSFDEIIVTTFTAGEGVQTLPIWIFTT
jgi:hypothetical protein